MSKIELHGGENTGCRRMSERIRRVKGKTFGAVGASESLNA